MVAVAPACTAAMQCGDRKKANKLDTLGCQSMVGVQYTADKTNTILTSILEKQDTIRNMMIQSVVFNFLTISPLVLPQEFERIQ